MAVVDTAWDGSASRFTDEQYEAACALDRKNCGSEWEDKPPKERCSLPYKEPNGDINKKGVAQAAGRIGSVTEACDHAVSAAKQKLRSAYTECDMDAPDSIKSARDLAMKGKRTERKEFRVDVPFTKNATLTASKGDLVISGYASTWGLDRDGECIHPEAFDGSLTAYLENNPIMLWQHDPDKPFGQVTSAKTDDTGLFIEAVIPKPAENEPPWLHLAYNKMQQGIVRTFSIGGYMTLMWDTDLEAPVIVKVELCEISVVSIPANETSIFTVAVKAIKGLDVKAPHLTGAMIEQVEQIVGIQPITDPELTRMSLDERDDRWRELAALYKLAGLDAPTRDEWHEATIVEGVPERLKAVVDVMSKAKGATPPVAMDLKAGRVLNKTNETALREVVQQLSDAASGIKGILDQLPEARGQEDDGPSHASIIEQAAIAPAQQTVPVG
jgi:HK97 family phage prohead protease